MLIVVDMIEAEQVDFVIMVSDHSNTFLIIISPISLDPYNHDFKEGWNELVRFSKDSQIADNLNDQISCNLKTYHNRWLKMIGLCFNITYPHWT